jgi:glycerophosphoryl diester phosphodiesterase
MRVFGHGTVDDINTLASFARMQSIGVDGVELDVRRTAGDGLVVAHDPDTDGPSLPHALDACRGLVVNIEIKNFPRDPQWDETQRVTDLVLDVLDERDGADVVLISCFHGACLDRCRQRRPDLPTALLLLSRRPPAELLDAPYRIVHPYDSMVNEQFMDEARKRDLLVNVWTGEDETLARMETLVDLGVDGIITAAPRVAMAARYAARR